MLWCCCNQTPVQPGIVPITNIGATIGVSWRIGPEGGPYFTGWQHKFEVDLIAGEHDTIEDNLYPEVFGHDLGIAPFGFGFGVFTVDYYWLILRQQVNVAQATPIVSATLDLFQDRSQPNYTIPIDLGIYFADFSWNGSFSTDPMDKPPWTQNHQYGLVPNNWTVSLLPLVSSSFTRDARIDVTPQVQAIIDRGDWNSGDRICLLIYTKSTTGLFETGLAPGIPQLNTQYWRSHVTQDQPNGAANPYAHGYIEIIV